MLAEPNVVKRVFDPYTQLMNQVSVRWVLGVGGALAMVAVLVWGLLENMESIALLAFGVGALFVYVAYTGQQITAFKAGGVEATLADAVTQTLRDPEVPETVKARISDHVQDVALPPPLRRATQQILSRQDQAMKYEADVGEALTRIGGAEWQVADGPNSGPFDFEVQRSRDGAIARVECKWSDEPPSTHQLTQWLRSLERVGPAGIGSLLVTSGKPPGTARHGVVTWGRPDDDDALLVAITNAFAVPQNQTSSDTPTAGLGE
ncbi:hypothetical protein GCM10009626_32430 [Brachybacterium sacelli]